MGNHTGAPLPPGNHKRWWKIVTPKKRQKLDACLLSNGFYGFWSHWIGRTVACLNTPECPWCRQDASRWGGYIPALVNEGGKTVERVLGLTKGAAEQLVAIEAERGGLRGLVVTLQRQRPPGQEKERDNDPVQVIAHHKKDPATLPEPFDVFDSVQRVFGLNEFWAMHARANGAAVHNALKEQHEKERARNHG